MAICCSKNQLLSACSSNLQFRLSIEFQKRKSKLQIPNLTFNWIQFFFPKTEKRKQKTKLRPPISEIAERNFGNWRPQLPVSNLDSVSGWLLVAIGILGIRFLLMPLKVCVSYWCPICKESYEPHKTRKIMKTGIRITRITGLAGSRKTSRKLRGIFDKTP